MIPVAQLARISIEAIVENCAHETKKYLAQKQYEAAYCFELFRRAIVDQNQRAWACIYTTYSSFVEGWVHEHSEFSRTGEERQYFVNQAFLNLARAFTPAQKFEHFSSLKAILAYLKACTHSAVRDEARKQRMQIVDLPDYFEVPAEDNVSQSVLEGERHDELAALIESRINNAKERVIIETYFTLSMKPRQIYEQNRTLFKSQQEVYRVKQNLLERWRRDEELMAMWR